MKKGIVVFFSPLILLASGDSMILFTILGVFIVTVWLFFLGIYKVIKTQKTIYMLGLVPFIVLMVYMFIK